VTTFDADPADADPRDYLAEPARERATCSPWVAGLPHCVGGTTSGARDLSWLTRRLRRTPYLEGLPRDVGVLSAISFCVALGFGIVAPAIPLFAKSFGVSVLAASAVISVFAFVRLISATPAGFLVNRVGERRVLVVGLAIVAVSSALAGLANDYTMLILLRGVGGLGSAMFTVSAMALLLRVVEPHQRGRAAGAFQGGFLLGGIAGPAVGGIVIGISLRLPFFVYAVTLGTASLVAATMLSHTHLRDRDPEGSVAAASADDKVLTLRHALGNRAYVTALAINLSNGFASFGLRSALIPLFVVESLRLGPQWSGYGLLASATMQGALLLPAGRMADTRGRKPALILGTGASVIGFTVLAITTSVPIFLLAMSILGFGAAFLGSAPAAVVGDVTGGRRGGPIVSTYQMMSDFGAVLAPLIAGRIVDTTGSFETGFLVGTGVLAVGFLLALSMPETLKRHAGSSPTMADELSKSSLGESWSEDEAESLKLPPPQGAADE